MVQLGQQVPPVQGQGAAVEVHAGFAGEGLVRGPGAQRLEPVGVQVAAHRRIPQIGPPLGQNGLQLAEQGLQHGADAVEQRLEGVDRVGAVVVRPERLDKLRLGDWPVPVQDQIGQYAPQLQRAVDVVGKGRSVQLQGKAPEQGDGNRFDHRWLCSALHTQGLLPGRMDSRFRKRGISGSSAAPSKERPP